MSTDMYKETSYKYRRNQKELLGKILSGALDEDLYIGNLRIDSTPQDGWELNPIFTGRCFASPHKLRIDVELDNWDMSRGLLANLFESSANISELTFSVKYTGNASYISQELTALCRYSANLEKAEIILADNVYLNGSGGMFYSCPALKTVILRSNNNMRIGPTSIVINGVVDTIVLDSPVVPTLSGSNLIASSVFVSGGTGGTIYIPKSLYDHLGDGTEYDYKSATNWSTIDSYGTITWAQIEGSEYELT